MQTKLRLMALMLLSIALFSCQKAALDPAIPETTKSVENQQVSGVTAPARNTQAETGNSLSECNYSEVALMAGQHMNAGTVTAVLDGDFIYVTYKTANGWYLNATHLYAGNCASLPVTKSGVAIPGQFPYKGTHNRVTEFIYRVPATVMGNLNCICMAAHAVVVKLNASGKVIAEETAWGAGTRINPNNWAMKFEFCSCEGN